MYVLVMQIQVVSIKGVIIYFIEDRSAIKEVNDWFLNVETNKYFTQNDKIHTEHHDQGKNATFIIQKLPSTISTVFQNIFDF